jgi:2-amino-4-hydroxy-6-hydroxymethyldihydropteridine diphosphokinase
MTVAYVGLGSNLGDRIGNVARAVDAISKLPETRVVSASHAYESVPAFVENQPVFVNAVVEIDTHLSADTLLADLLEIERNLGRVREIDKGPRVIDLDLLLYGDEEWDSERLTLPHPGIRERDFVLTPLLEIAPRTKLPDGTPLRRSEASVGDVLRDLGPLPELVVDHDRPVATDEWVVVAESVAVDAIAGFDALLQVKAEALDQEGIPYAYDPYPPGTDIEVFGMTQPFRLRVPAEHAEHAATLLVAIESAPFVEDPEETAEEAPATGSRRGSDRPT